MTGAESINRRSYLTAVLATAMGVSVMPAAVVGVLATFIIEDFGITRTQLGILAAAMSATGAFTSTSLGKLTDRVGGRSALIGVFALGGVGLAGLAAAPSFLMALVAACVAGVALGGSNPATNKLVVSHVPYGERGIITGVKQAGEMVAFAASGAILPVAAVAIGWRPALALAALVPLAAIIRTYTLVPRDQGTGEVGVQRSAAPRLRAEVWWLAVHGSLFGMAAGSVTAYLPLYASESVGLSVTQAGGVMFVVGIVAVAGRVLWSRMTERTGRFRRSLAWLTGLAAVSTIILLAATPGSSAFVWVGGVGWGSTALSYGSVGMLAAMVASDHDTAGRASGVVAFGFSAGISLGPPLFGYMVDLTGGYETSFMLEAAVFCASLLVVAIWQKTAQEVF